MLTSEQHDGADTADAQEEASSVERRNDTAREALENYARLMGEKRFVETAQELEKLERTLGPPTTIGTRE